LAQQGAAPVSLELRDVGFSYGPARVVEGLSLRVESGEMVALLGPSGCGKTSILKLVAGLFPYLSVAENVGFSLKMKGIGIVEARDRVREALALVKLDGFEERRPNKLSGGQEQRVSLARALVSDPAVLLLDEPFAALDESLRMEIRNLVRSIQRRLSLTTVFVTHDQLEAAAVAHRIAFLDDGRVQQIGSLRDFYERPEGLAAARFFGWQVIDDHTHWAVVRPESIQFAETGMRAVVERSADLGTSVLTRVLLQPSHELLEVKHGLPELSSGQTVHLQFADASALRFPKS
jgi:ABC-type Fe3+/spermidine/putrescine transport system ATPase subunit